MKSPYRRADYTGMMEKRCLSEKQCIGYGREERKSFQLFYILGFIQHKIIFLSRAAEKMRCFYPLSLHPSVSCGKVQKKTRLA